MTKLQKGKKDAQAKDSANSSVSVEKISTYFKQLNTGTTTLSPEQIRKRKRQSAMDGDISPITSVDDFILDDIHEQMETEKTVTKSTSTEITSADEALVEEAKDRPKITIAKKSSARDKSPVPEIAKAPFLEAKKWAEKVSRVQSLLEFLSPFIGGDNVPYLITIKFQPKLGIEDDDFLRLWNAATHKCSKWLMESAFNQAKASVVKYEAKYAEAVNGLRRAAGPISETQLMDKVAKYKQENLHFSPSREPNNSTDS